MQLFRHGLMFHPDLGWGRMGGCGALLLCAALVFTLCILIATVLLSTVPASLT